MMDRGGQNLLNGANILIIYERKLTQELLASTLKQAGGGTILSCQPNETIFRIREFTPAFVFCEYSMTLLNGAQVVQQLRKELHVAAPAAMLIHRGDVEALTRTKAVGVNVFITVPFAVSDVIAAVKKLTAKGGAAERKELYFGE
jgi:DNA-binding response OmpR family regulator